MTARDVYIQRMSGSFVTGVRLIQIAAAMPIVTQKNDETKDRSVLGALVYAISRPVTMTNASEKATRM